MFKKGDLLIYIIIIALMAGSFLFVSGWRNSAGSGRNIAVIKQGDKELRRIDLDAVKEPYKIEIGGKYQDVVLVEKGRIRFIEADCPDKVCIRTGWISRKGDAAVCIPNRLIIKVEGEEGKVDGVAY